MALSSQRSKLPTPQNKSNRRSVFVDLGTVPTAPPLSVCLSEQDHLVEHLAIYGGTGRGKSKFLELLLRQLMEQGRGFCLIDPHGDLTKELAAFIYMKLPRLPRKLIDNLHYLEPASARTFSFDPFEYHGDPALRHRWLQAKVDETARAILRKQGKIDFRGMQRLERWLKTVLYACGIPIDDTGRHLPLSDALVLVYPQNKYHDVVFKRIRDQLPGEYLDNFDKLRGTKNSGDQEDWVESTINWLGSFLSGPVQSILGCERPSLNFRQVIDNGGVILANLAASQDMGFSEDQGSAVGGLLINEIIGTAMATERGDRPPFYLIVDEANYYMGEDLAKALKRTRKRGLSIWLGFQDIASMKDEHADMTGQVLSQCAVQISFQQKNPADLEILSQFFGDPNLDFKKLVMPVDRPDGYDWIPVDESTDGVTKGTSRECSLGTSEAAGDSEARGNSFANEESVTNSSGSSHRSGDLSHTEVTSSASKTQGSSTTKSSTSTTQHIHTDTVVNSEGENESRSRSVAHRLIPLARTRVEYQDQGRLLNPLDAQYAKIRSALRTLPKAHAIISVQHHRSFPFRVHRVLDIVEGNLALPKAHVIEDLKEFIYAQHNCYFIADLTMDAQKGRLQRFIEAMPHPSEETKPKPDEASLLDIDEPPESGFSI